MSEKGRREEDGVDAEFPACGIACYNWKRGGAS
jgi:hypothetical protein